MDVRGHRIRPAYCLIRVKLALMPAVQPSMANARAAIGLADVLFRIYREGPEAETTSIRRPLPATAHSRSGGGGDPGIKGIKVPHQLPVEAAQFTDQPTRQRHGSPVAIILRMQKRLYLPEGNCSFQII